MIPVKCGTFGVRIMWENVQIMGEKLSQAGVNEIQQLNKKRK